MAKRQWYEFRGSKVSKRLRDQLRNGAEEDPLPVIIMFHNGREGCKDDLCRRMQRLGGAVRRELPLIGGFSAVMTKRALADISPRDEVRQVHLDRICRPCLDIAVPSVLVDRAQRAGYTGKGITIAVLDSGIYPHADFVKPEPRIVGWYDTINHRARPYDDHGHGSHVAGIAAGNGYASDGRYRGVAPEAGIVAVKVADSQGSAPMSRVIEGLQWVLDNREKYGIRIVNLSLGSDPSESFRDDPLCQAVEQVWKAGIVVVVAAGNDGPKPGSIDTPGNDPMIITVGAVDDVHTAERGDDLVPDFSSRGPTNDGLGKPDLLAPGVNIYAPQAGGGYVNRTGTSMATPVVSGAVALLLAANPDLTPDEVKRRLSVTAERDRRLSTRGGRPGYLDVSRLLDLPSDEAQEAIKPERPPLRLAIREKLAYAAEREVRGALKGGLAAMLKKFTDKPLLFWLLDALF